VKGARKIAGSLCAAAAVLVAACGPVASEQEGSAPGPGGDAGVPADEPGAFIAFQRDFQAFASWTRFDLVSDTPAGTGNVHTAGKRTVYINQPPAAGARSFANGTIIVKTMETGETFARVKRGAGYNKLGARGWEWFELKAVEGEWVIIWRGIAPPAGLCSYGGIEGGACNTCHQVFVDNDYVATSALALSPPL
jgi:hypothetical protein